MTASRARDEFSDLLNRAAYKGERIVLRRRGRDVAAMRVGDWRLVYRVEDDRLLVLVLRVGHRREVYR